MKDALLIMVGVFLIIIIAFVGIKPVAVQKAFTAKYPKVTDVKWGKEGNTEYEADFMLEGKKMSANFRDDGTWIETDTVVPTNDVPQGVIEYMNKNKPGCATKEAARVELADGKILYQVETKNSQYLFDAHGNLLKVVKG